MIESPGTWPDRQRAFHHEYDRDPGSLPRQPVVWQAVAAPPVVKLVSDLTRGWQEDEPPVLAVWHDDAPPGLPAMLIFEVEPLPADAQGSGVLVGDAAPPTPPPTTNKEVVRGRSVALAHRILLVAAAALTAWAFFALPGDETRAESQARRDAEGYSTSERLFLLGVALILILGVAEVAWRCLRRRQRLSR